MPQSKILLSRNGTPMLCIDGKPSTCLMHWHRHPGMEVARFFAECGIDLLSFIGHLPLRKEPDVAPDYSDGMGATFRELTHEAIDGLFHTLLQGNPRLLVLPRLRITVPKWWKEEHPETLIQSYSLTRRTIERGPHVSAHCKEWRSLVAHSLEETVRYLETRWADHILGYHSGMYECAEHAWRWGDFIADLNQAELPAYRLWLKEKYGSDQGLRDAWHRSDISLADAAFPDCNDFLPASPTDARVLFDPQREQHVLDFLAFGSQTMADIILFQASVVKRTLHAMGREKVFGAFYGYFNLLPNAADDYSLPHFDTERLLASPDVDFFAAPVCYDARQAGGCANSQAVSGAIAAAGKLFYSEEDTRLHRARPCPDCVSGDANTSRQILLRDFFSAWRTGASCWWMDLAGKGWFREESFQTLFRECRAIAEETLQCHRTPAQIAVFVSEESMRYNRCAPTSLHGPLVGQNLNEIAAVGAPYDFFRLEDLPRLRKRNFLASYRLCIFLNAIDVSDVLRQEIDFSLKRDGRTLLWYYLPGAFWHGQYDMDAAGLLTGLRMRLLQDDQLASLLTESWLDGRRISYGHPRNVLPRMTCVDPEAEPLGWYCEDGGSCHPDVGTGVSFARRHFAEWTSVWSGSPLLPSLWLQTFAREAGVHLYSERGDLVFPVGDYLGVSSKAAGVIPLRLPHASDVWDAETGECLAKNATALDLPAARGEWRLLRIGITDCPF